jgi:hypothetical protein
MNFACSPDQRKDDYTSSVILHNSIMEKARLIERDLDMLRHTSLPKEALDSLEFIAKELSEWQCEVVEVPGNDVDSHQSHSHEHTRAPVKVTPEQMLEIQKELDSSLSAIGKKLANMNPRNDNNNGHQH